MLCDSGTKFVLNFIIYAGIETEIDNHPEVGISGSVVLSLMAKYLEKTTPSSLIIGSWVLHYLKDYWNWKQRPVGRWEKTEMGCRRLKNWWRAADLSEHWWAAGTQMDGQKRGSYAYYIASTHGGPNWKRRQRNRIENQETFMCCAIQQIHESSWPGGYADQFLRLPSKKQ